MDKLTSNIYLRNIILMLWQEGLGEGDKGYEK